MGTPQGGMNVGRDTPGAGVYAGQGVPPGAGAGGMRMLSYSKLLKF